MFETNLTFRNYINKIPCHSDFDTLPMKGTMNKDNIFGREDIIFFRPDPQLPSLVSEFYDDDTLEKIMRRPADDMIDDSAEFQQRLFSQNKNMDHRKK